MRIESPQIECVLDAAAQVGESPLWSVADQKLWWCDIDGCVLHRFDPLTGRDEIWQMPAEPGCMALAEDGALIVALRNGLHHFAPQTGVLTLLTAPDYPQGTTRFNDGRCDARGRFWVGTLYAPRDSQQAALYAYDGIVLRQQVSHLTVANGLAFSPDGRTAYLADSPARQIDCFDFDLQAGLLTRRRLFQRFAVEEGRPDGAAVDADGNYWIALYAGGALLQIAPDGTRLRRLDLPVRRPTMLAFGGAALDEIYVTTARAGADAVELAAYPQSGALLRLRIGVRGRAEPHFVSGKVNA